MTHPKQPTETPTPQAVQKAEPKEAPKLEPQAAPEAPAAQQQSVQQLEPSKQKPDQESASTDETKPASTEKPKPMETAEPTSAPKPAASQPSDGKAAFDKTIALKRVGGDEAFLKELIEIFLEETPNLMNQVRQAMAEEDSTTLRRAAHSIKGSASNFGAVAVCTLAARLEEMGKGNDLTGAEPAFADLEKAIEKTFGALSAFTRGEAVTSEG